MGVMDLLLGRLTKLAQIDVNIQDQTTQSIILPLVRQLGLTALTNQATIDLYDVVVDSLIGTISNLAIGDHFRIIDSGVSRFYSGTVLNLVGSVVTLDTPIDFEYSAGSEVTWSNINMNVNGSVTPVHFHLRTGSPSIASAVDITRIIMVAESTNAVDLEKFADIPGGLTRGIVFREENGSIHNVFNIKSNSGLVGLGYDWTPFDSSKPNEGVNGFAWRLTFGGQSKIGVTLRIEQDGQLGMIIQDDLSSLISLFCIVEGHIVE